MNEPSSPIRDMWNRPAILVCSGIILGGCSESGKPMLPSVQVDTIGSTVIVRHPPLTAESLSVEVVTVGREAASDAGEPDEFGLIQAAVLTDDGQLVVADAYASQVRVFTSDGGFVRAFGRRGAGPGEYQRLQ